MSLNLNEYSFEEWVNFVFNHPVATSSTAWYWDDEWEWESDSEHIIEYCIRLFRNPDFLLECYSPEQINQGFWFLLGATFQLQDWLWNRDIDWKLREECILAMVDVFEKMFARYPIEDVCYMWWDLLRDFSDDQDPKVKDAMIIALSRILEFDSLDCRLSALHGLGHLEHKGKRKVIEQFLAAQPGLDDEVRDYAMAAIEGKVL
ncbi:MAG: hypothetical protein M3384_18865 [Acidobacteriota bacterium]|nr:hypothetical protein [Acidobacteriota bacterium]